MKLPSNRLASAAVSVCPETGTKGCAQLMVTTVRGDVVERVLDCVAEEIPVALVYNDEPYVVMMTTPADLEDFALGFSLSEGLIEATEELQSIRVTALGVEVGNGYQIDLQIPPLRQQALASRRRNLNGRSGCGLCGAQSIEAAIRHPRRVPAGTRIDDGALRRALSALRQRQNINARTGATHAAAWAQPDGSIQLVREDVGRHNALDKLIGALAAQRHDFTCGFLLITSRASYEMVLKSATMGIPFIVAISAPTTFATQLAEEAGMTLVGFARERGYVVYACPARLTCGPAHNEIH